MRGRMGGRRKGWGMEKVERGNAYTLIHGVSLFGPGSFSFFCGEGLDTPPMKYDDAATGMKKTFT